MGILTSNNAANVRRFLAANDLPGFHFIYTSRNIFGKSRVLRRILRQERLLHREVLFIGDEIRDVEAGKKLQIDTVAVCWGVNSKKALQSAGPDYIIDHPADLTSLLL
jgi:phosphoglycolate phosphatase